MSAVASSTVAGIGALALLAAFGGYTASFACLVLERRPLGRPVTGRSACVCGTPIPMYRNIPVVTWLVQRGRAACCGSRIPAWYLGAEAGTAVAPVAAVLLVHRAPVAAALLAIVLAVVLTAASVRLHSPSAHPATNEGDD